LVGEGLEQLDLPLIKGSDFWPVEDDGTDELGLFVHWHGYQRACSTELGLRDAKWVTFFVCGILEDVGYVDGPLLCGKPR
jgi:hypothetical protein